MRYVLARGQRSALTDFARSNVLLAFDFDGTLAPIVSAPAEARMRAGTRALLSRLALIYPCVIISGRRRLDVVRRLQGVSVGEVIGNHGIEPWQARGRARREVRRWLPLLVRRLRRVPGVEIENKRFSIALHYRRSRRKQAARAALRAAAGALGPVRLVAGKEVLNLLPPGAPDKGIALEEALCRFGCNRAIYVGDDETDEDVFSLGQPERLLTIRVGRKLGSQAAYFLRNQAEIDALLRRLLAQRRTRAAGVIERAV